MTAAGSKCPRVSTRGRFQRSGSHRERWWTCCSRCRQCVLPAWRSAIRLRFLAEVSKLGLEFVARGRLLPDLARCRGGWVARWRPIAVDPDDADRIRLLVDA